MLSNVNIAISEYNNLLNLSTELQQKTVAINIGRINQSRALGTTDRSALGLLNGIPLEGSDVQGALGRFRSAQGTPEKRTTRGQG